MSSILKIITDIQCQIYCDYKKIGEAFPNTIFKIELRKGTYIIEFKKENFNLSTVKYKMESNDEEDLFEISLSEIYHKECERIRRKRISEKEITWFYTGQNWRIIDVNDEALNPLTKESWIDLPCNYNLLPMHKTVIPNVDACGYIPFNVGGKLLKDDSLEYTISGGSWGCLDKTGRVVIQPIYGRKVFFLNNQVTSVFNQDSCFCGIINYLGEKKFEQDFERIFPIDEKLGFYEVSKLDRYGIINKYGNVIVPLRYLKFSFRTKDLIWAQDPTSNKWGLIKYDSSIIQPFIYDKIENANDGFFVSCNKKWGTINIDGKIVIDTKYQIVAVIPIRLYNKNNPSAYNEDDFIYTYQTIVKINDKYGVVNTNFRYESNTIVFKEIISCIYDAIYSFSGIQYSDEDLIKETTESQYCQDFCSISLSYVYFVKRGNGVMQCDNYDNKGQVLYSFICNEFNDVYKILSNKFYLKNKESKFDTDPYDLISSIDFYNGTLYEEGVYPENWDGKTGVPAIDVVKKRHKVTYLLGKKENKWVIFDKNDISKIIFSYECDSIIEFGELCRGGYFAIVQNENLSKLLIISDFSIEYESDYMMEIHSSYNELTHSKISYSDKYFVNGLSDDYFIVKLCNNKWQVFVYDYSCKYEGVDIFKSPEFDFIRFINEYTVEICAFHNKRTLYNTMNTLCWNNMQPDTSRWEMSPIEERNCNLVAVYDFKTDKEGVVIEENDKLSEGLFVDKDSHIIGKITEKVIVPFEWDYTRVFYSKRNIFIAVGKYTDNKSRNCLNTLNAINCALMDTNKNFLTEFIWEPITRGNSTNDLCFHCNGYIAEVDLLKDDVIYSLPFLNYESIDNEGQLHYGSPFRNVRLYIDTETTGLPLNYKKSYSDLHNWPYIVQVALIIEDDNLGILAKRNMIIKPDGYTIPPSSTKIHGITTNMAINNGEERKRVLSFLDKVLYYSDMIIGHNVSFDLNVIKAEILRIKGPDNALFCKKENIIFDTMKIGTNICKIPNTSFLTNKIQPYKYPTLDELYYKLFNKHFYNQHNAMSDIQATYDCYYKLKTIL